MGRRKQAEDVIGASNINAQYMLDLEFENVKHIMYSVEEKGLPRGNIFVTIMIQMDAPCSCRKKNFINGTGRQRMASKSQSFKFDAIQNSRSPLNMGEDHDCLFLNNWNLSQTFYLKGQTTVGLFENFKQVLAKRCLTATIVEEKGPLGVQILDIESCKQEMRELKVRGLQFRKLLDSLRLQLMYAVLSLLSESKVSLFNPSILKLVDDLVRKGWSNNDRTATFAAFLIDKMHNELDPSLRPFENLCEVFKKVRSNRENHLEFEESARDPNMLRQYRVNVSPTLIKVSPGREEETNRVIRRFSHNLQSFVRLNFITERDGKGFYFGESSGFLLGYIHKIMHSGFYLGNRCFKFL